MISKMGLMQGRLSVPVNNHMQEFPDNWEEEFLILNECGLEGMEWLVTKNCSIDNPIYQKPKTVAKFPITSICLDTLVDRRIIEVSYLETHLGSLCEILMKDTALRNITIPLLEDSSMEDEDIRKKFISAITIFADRFPEMCFTFEAELGKEELSEIVNLRDNFYVTYDTGNITSYGLSHLEYIHFFAGKINNVHLKDRTFDATTVTPSSGDTDFETIFKGLREIGYNGPYTIQTARGTTGKEKETILEHMHIFQEIFKRVAHG
jgi:L-ribulose-5-phosphate 3-epimerase